MSESELNEVERAAPVDAKQRRSPRRTSHSTAVIKGYRDIKRALDTCTLDKRTKLSQELDGLQEQLVSHLGGWDQISAMQAMTIESLSRTYLLLRLVDSYAFSNGLLVDKRKRRAHQILADRTRLSDSMLRHLSLLGLEKKLRGKLTP